MSNRFGSSLLGVTLLVAAGCSDGSGTAAPIVPAPQVIGMLKGTVRGMAMTAEYMPTGSDFSPATGFSPAIYGSAATVKVSGTVDSLHVVAGVSRTWFIRVHMRNLLSYPIGANSGAAIPSDTGGVFLVFTSLPVVTEPYNCVVDHCNISLFNQMGAGNFGSPAQPYFWYHDRPTAVKASPGTDTTSDAVWQFRTTSVTPPDTAGAFTFVLYVSAQWPPPNETNWTTTYDGTADSLPDTQASPLWKTFVSSGANTLGTETFTGGAMLQLVASTAAKSFYFARNDSMGTGAHDYHIDARLKIENGAGNRIQAVIGFAEPGGKQAFLGVSVGRVSLATYNSANGQWAVLGTTYNNGGAFSGSQYHTYRLRKLDNTDVHWCVDGVDVGSLTYASLQATQADFTNRQEVWGIDGRAGSAVVDWTSALYQIGNDGGSC